MASDSLDASYASSSTHKPLVVKRQEVASVETAHSREKTQTEPLPYEFELLLSTLQTSLFDLRNSPVQFRLDLEIWRTLLGRTRRLLEDTGNRLPDSVSVKLWLADVMEVLNDMDDVLDEIMDANRYRLTAEDQSSANKPWKLIILNLFNKLSRFMHDPDKEMASKVSDITNRFHPILEEAIRLGLIERLDTEDKAGPENLGRREFAMLNAIRKGKFWKVRGFYKNYPDAISTTFENGQTALHAAITAGQLRIAQELIASISTENRHHLEIRDERGNTALSLAARSGMMEIAKLLIGKNKNLLTIPDDNSKIPVQLACRTGNEDLTHYLYRHTPLEFLDGDYGFYLLEECVDKKMFEIALHLLYSFPKFAIYILVKDSSIPIIRTLAWTPPPFFKGNQLAFWRRWIYNCIRVKVDKRSVLSGDVGIVAAQRSGALVSILPKFLVKKIYDLKLLDTTAREIIHFIIRRFSTLNRNQLRQSGVYRATLEAIENGNPEIVIEIAKANTNILGNSTDSGNFEELFAHAVRYRQEELVQFLYGCNARIGTNVVFTTNRYRNNNLLHLAAELAPRSQLDSISGAALQLQSEIRWFKAVEGIVPQFFKHQKVRYGRIGSVVQFTPTEVFLKEHEQLLKDAEEWMKKTAESSTVVGALIITIMFAVAFTVPGGNDQQTGFPIFLNKTADSSMVSSPTVPFMVFVASDAISLFAASSSVLMFLGILTSRYAYEDFLKSLPMKLIIGISLLFISIAAMMVAFCVALFIMLQGRLWIIIPVTLLAGIPVIIFVLLQFPFLVDLYTLTFGPGIFDRKKNINIGKGRDG